MSETASAQWDRHVLPHGPLDPIAPGLWQVTGSLPKSPLPRNMQVWRSPSRELLIHSAVCLDAEEMTKLEALGKVRWIVVPCGLHRLDALPYRERYPDALMLCPAAARDKVEEVVAIDGLCEEVLPAIGVTVHQPKGLKPFELHYLLPLEDGSKALLVTDALFNLGRSQPKGFGGLLLKWMGSVGPLGMTRIGRWLLLKDRAQWKTYLEQLASTPGLSVLCMSHGEAVLQDVRQALREVSS